MYVRYAYDGDSAVLGRDRALNVLGEIFVDDKGVLPIPIAVLLAPVLGVCGGMPAEQQRDIAHEGIVTLS
jgi:hypothetical protein